MKLLIIDPGRTYGLIYYDDKIVTSKNMKFTDMEAFYNDVLGYAKNGVKYIIHGTPCRHFNVMKYQNKQIGVIDLVANQVGCCTLPIIDSQAKLKVIGKGNAKKPEIMAFYKEDDEHIADCRMFLDYFLKFQ